MREGAGGVDEKNLEGQWVIGSREEIQRIRSAIERLALILYSSWMRSAVILDALNGAVAMMVAAAHLHPHSEPRLRRRGSNDEGGVCRDTLAPRQAICPTGLYRQRRGLRQPRPNQLSLNAHARGEPNEGSPLSGFTGWSRACQKHANGGAAARCRGRSSHVTTGQGRAGSFGSALAVKTGTDREKSIEGR